MEEKKKKFNLKKWIKDYGNSILALATIALVIVTIIMASGVIKTAKETQKLVNATLKFYSPNHFIDVDIKYDGWSRGFTDLYGFTPYGIDEKYLNKSSEIQFKIQIFNKGNLPFIIDNIQYLTDCYSSFSSAMKIHYDDNGKIIQIEEDYDNPQLFWWGEITEPVLIKPLEIYKHNFTISIGNSEINTSEILPCSTILRIGGSDNINFEKNIIFLPSKNVLDLDFKYKTQEDFDHPFMKDYKKIIKK